jgi:N-acetyl-1-D-myo-inositol-2-amino-2-deoxy-alpha-D-glucopyranoside deacetylase
VAVAPERVLLAVHAHPDDECISTGGVLARYAASGVRTVLVTCTDGAVGEISDPALATPENLVEVRARELDASVRILGVSRLVKLGYRDSGMAGTADNLHPLSFAQADFSEAVARVVQVMREERPQVVVTYDENGGYGHPDHIRAHQVAVAACKEAAPQAKLYYVVIPRSAIQRFVERMRETGFNPPVAERSDDFGVADERVTTRIDVSEFTTVKRQALLAHQTQLGPDMWFAKVPEALWADFSGTEFFQLISGPTSDAEDDLFAGI